MPTDEELLKMVDDAQEAYIHDQSDYAIPERALLMAMRTAYEAGRADGQTPI